MQGRGAEEMLIISNGNVWVGLVEVTFKQNLTHIIDSQTLFSLWGYIMNKIVCLHCLYSSEETGNNNKESYIK